MAGGMGALQSKNLLGSTDSIGGVAEQPNFLPRAKRVIYLFMAGAPSQLDLFDFKPRLAELEGDYAGVAGLKRFFAALGATTQGTFDVQVVSTTPLGDES